MEIRFNEINEFVVKNWFRKLDYSSKGENVGADQKYAAGANFQYFKSLACFEVGNFAKCRLKMKKH